LKVTQAKGSTTRYGEGLKRKDELILSEHFGQRYLWVECPPFSSEGFPYKRHPQRPHLSTTCDLIAPHGAGEMVGVAEKITDAEELVVNLIEKGQKDNIYRYWNYIALRQYGMPPHGGIGAAPERIIYGLLGLDHIRLTKPWPRYPDRRIVALKGPLPTYGNPVLESIVDKYRLEKVPDRKVIQHV
jgi:aspartyl/asparaginyl-tRNA synthetase